MWLWNDLGGCKFLGIKSKSFRISSFKSEQDNFDSENSIRIGLIFFQGTLFISIFFSSLFFVRTKLWSGRLRKLLRRWEGVEKVLRRFRESAFRENSLFRCDQVGFLWGKVWRKVWRRCFWLNEKMRRRSILPLHLWFIACLWVKSVESKAFQRVLEACRNFSEFRVLYVQWSHLMF